MKQKWSKTDRVRTYARRSRGRALNRQTRNREGGGQFKGWMDEGEKDRRKLNRQAGERE